MLTERLAQPSLSVDMGPIVQTHWLQGVGLPQIEHCDVPSALLFKTVQKLSCKLVDSPKGLVSMGLEDFYTFL